LTHYYFTKLSKLNKLQLALTDEQIIDVIIEGNGDTQVQLTLRAANCRTFVDFAAYIKNIPNSQSKSAEMTCGTKRTYEERYKIKQGRMNRQELESAKVKCFSCHEIGHKRNNCPKLQKAVARCSFCHKMGHEEKVCRKKRFQEKVEARKNINFIGPIQDSIYFKRAKINNHKLDKCFVDLGCQWTLIKQSVALKIGLTQTEIINEKIELSGFSGETLTPKFQCRALLTIDGVGVTVNMYRVEQKYHIMAVTY
jgi:hypothetical protein